MTYPHLGDAGPEALGLIHHDVGQAVLAEEVEESLAHGLLDCVECGLCSFVCPSKIDLLQALRRAREAYCDDIA